MLRGISVGNSYSGVTERAGNMASFEQLQILKTRYDLAFKYAKGADIVEYGCGSGVGLYLLAPIANNVLGLDLDNSNVEIAREDCQEFKNIQVVVADAEKFISDSAKFDLALAFECIYYFNDLSLFFENVASNLKSGGTLIISSVNPCWHSFNPSPYSTKYLSGEELKGMLHKRGFQCELFYSFYDFPSGISAKLKKFIKQMAVKFKLIPKTMKGKVLLKRIFMGKLSPIPRNLNDIDRPAGELFSDITSEQSLNYKMFYLICKID